MVVAHRRPPAQPPKAEPIGAVAGERKAVGPIAAPKASAATYEWLAVALLAFAAMTFWLAAAPASVGSLRVTRAIARNRFALVLFGLAAAATAAIDWLLTRQSFG